MDALTLTPKCILYVLLYSFTYFSRENTDRGINHSFHAEDVLVASKAIIIFSLQIGIGYEIMYCHTLVYVK